MRSANELIERARSFQHRIGSVKAGIQPREFDWYPYDSLGNVLHVERLLNDTNVTLPELLDGAETADIGCGDGDFAFFLESLGCRVHAIDYPPSNHNGMRGVRALKEALRSAVEIHAVDIDGRFVLPAERYGVAFLMGVIYHLKNPFYALETLSKQVKHCFLSTRVAATLPGTRTSIRDWPVACLVDSNELNNDDSNFWLLTEAGLRRLLARTKWEIRAWFAAGVKGSDAADCRAFCLARSHYAMAHLELLSGWHAAEEGGFRWTERRFAVRRPADAARMTLDFFLPDARRIELEAAAGGARLGAQQYKGPGRHTYARSLPRAGERIDFEIDHALPPDAHDLRERGIIAGSLEFEAG
jgi:hypothetical protein